MLMILPLAALAQAAGPSATVTWTAPTTNTNGTPVSTLTYNLYQGLSGALAKVQSGIATTTLVVTTGLTVGTTQCFAVTAVEGGVESAQSNVACSMIALPTPGAPSQVVIVITGT